MTVVTNYPEEPAIARDRCWNCWSTDHTNTRSCPLPTMSIIKREEIRVSKGIPKPEDPRYTEILLSITACTNCWETASHTNPTCPKPKNTLAEADGIRYAKGIVCSRGWKEKLEAHGIVPLSGGKASQNASGRRGIAAREREILRVSGGPAVSNRSAGFVRDGNPGPPLRHLQYRAVRNVANARPNLATPHNNPAIVIQKNPVQDGNTGGRVHRFKRRCWNCWGVNHLVHACPKPRLRFCDAERLRIELNLPKPTNPQYDWILLQNSCTNCWASYEHDAADCPNPQLSVSAQEQLRHKRGIPLMHHWIDILKSNGLRPIGTNDRRAVQITPISGMANQVQLEEELFYNTSWKYYDPHLSSSEDEGKQGEDKKPKPEPTITLPGGVRLKISELPTDDVDKLNAIFSKKIAVQKKVDEFVPRPEAPTSSQKEMIEKVAAGNKQEHYNHHKHPERREGVINRFWETEDWDKLMPRLTRNVHHMQPLQTAGLEKEDPQPALEKSSNIPKQPAPVPQTDQSAQPFQSQAAEKDDVNQAHQETQSDKPQPTEKDNITQPTPSNEPLQPAPAEEASVATPMNQKALQRAENGTEREARRQEREARKQARMQVHLQRGKLAIERVDRFTEKLHAAIVTYGADLGRADKPSEKKPAVEQDHRLSDEESETKAEHIVKAHPKNMDVPPKPVEASNLMDSVTIPKSFNSPVLIPKRTQAQGVQSANATDKTGKIPHGHVPKNSTIGNYNQTSTSGTVYKQAAREIEPLQVPGTPLIMPRRLRRVGDAGYRPTLAALRKPKADIEQSNNSKAKTSEVLNLVNLKEPVNKLGKAPAVTGPVSLSFVEFGGYKDDYYDGSLI